MAETLKTVLSFVVIWAALEVVKNVFGGGVSMAVALAALSFCIGALWGAGDAKKDHHHG